MSQHQKFKFFSFHQTYDVDQQISKQVNEWVQTNQVQACSIGVEYVERLNCLLVSLGYLPGIRLTTPGGGQVGSTSFPVELHTVKLGRLSLGKLDTLEILLEAEAQKFDGVICHEFYVNQLNDVVAVFLVQSKA